jgi:hypothetical protein
MFSEGFLYILAENLLNDVKDLLATLGYLNEQKVAYTAFKLIGEAKSWWQDMKWCLSLTWVQRLSFLGKSSSMSSIDTSFPESCRRRRQVSFWIWSKEGCR